MNYTFDTHCNAEETQKKLGLRATDTGDSKSAVCAIAKALSSIGATMSASHLAELLNAYGIRTRRGTCYIPGTRGIYKVISSVYAKAVAEKNDALARMLADAFLDSHGRYAYG